MTTLKVVKKLVFSQEDMVIQAITGFSAEEIAFLDQVCENDTLLQERFEMLVANHNGIGAVQALTAYGVRRIAVWPDYVELVTHYSCD